MPVTGARSTPSSWRRKSRCQKSRRNSPSVTTGRPSDSCLATAVRMHRSSTSRSCAAEMAPAFARVRASWSSGGRKRLPTCSARNGGVVAMFLPPAGCLYYARDANPLDRRSATHRGRRRQAAAPTLPSTEWMIEQVKLLSAPDTDGRGSGTPGAERAARHIADVFRAAGLRPGGDGQSYLQAFTVPTGTRLGAVNTLALVAPAARTFTLGTDFTPLAVSDRWRRRGRGRLCRLRHHRARSAVRRLRRARRTGPHRHRDHGRPARRRSGQPVPPPGGVSLLAADAQDHQRARARRARDPARLASPRAGGAPRRCAGCRRPHGILAAFVMRATADALLAPSGRSVAELAAAIDRALAPQSFVLAGVRVRCELTLVRERATTANVIGMLPGHDARLRDEAIVIGAHYDHLGHGGEGSLAPESIGRAHPGADDNASGTTVVLALARAFAAARAAPAHARLRHLRRRGAGPARLGPLRGPSAVSAGPHGAHGERRHGGSPARAPSLRGRRGQRHRPAHRGQRCRAGPRPVARATRQPLRAVGSHVVLHRGPPGPVPLHRAPRRLPPAQRHVGQDQRAGAGQRGHARRPRGRCRRQRRDTAGVGEGRRAARDGGPRGSGYGAYFGVVPDFGGAAATARRPACGSAACGLAVRRTRPDSRAATSSCASPA